MTKGKRTKGQIKINKTLRES